jgi:hypothetical protein
MVLLEPDWLDLGTAAEPLLTSPNIVEKSSAFVSAVGVVGVVVELSSVVGGKAVGVVVVVAELDK